MNQYAAALSLHPIPALAAGEIAGELLDQLGGEAPDLLAIFTSPHHTGAFDDIVAALDQLLSPASVFGGSAAAVIGGAREVEAQAAISVLAARFERTASESFALEFAETPDGPTITGWPDTFASADVDRGAPPGSGPTMLLFADPFSFPVDAVIGRLRSERPDVTVVGGMASAASRAHGNRFVFHGGVRTEGTVGVLIDADVAVEPIVAQGARPIGEPFTITAAERNLVQSLGGEPPLDRFRAMTETLTDAERALLRSGLTVGLLVGDDRTFTRTDQLIRGVLGADRTTGALAVAGEVGVGQVLQFHVRDSLGADDELRARLTGCAGRGGLMFTCNGRGQAFFGAPDHDARVVEELIGPIPLAGAFCAGEIGPVGGGAHLHTQTASLALFG